MRLAKWVLSPLQCFSTGRSVSINYIRERSRVICETWQGLRVARKVGEHHCDPSSTPTRAVVCCVNKHKDNGTVKHFIIQQMQKYIISRYN